MIWVKITTQDSMVKTLEVTGHADFGEHGQDIVCAACALVSVGLLNAIDEMCNGQCELLQEENRIYIEVKENDERLQTALNVGIIQYKTLAEEFRKYIRVKKTEVKL